MTTPNPALIAALDNIDRALTAAYRVAQGPPPEPTPVPAPDPAAPPQPDPAPVDPPAGDVVPPEPAPVQPAEPTPAPPAEPTGLPAPVNVRATAADLRITVTCDPVPGATHYAWYERRTPGRPVGVTTAPTRTSGGLSRTSPRYFYAVAARAGADGPEGPRSAELEVSSVTGTDVPAPAPAPAPVTPPVTPVVTKPVTPPTPTPAPRPGGLTRTPSEPPSVVGPYTRVGTADALTAALAAARDGELIVVSARQVLTGRFVVTTPRLTLILEDGAGIDGGSVTGGYALHFKGAPGAVVAGGQVFGAQKGFIADGSSGCKTLGVHIHSTGMEAWHIRGFTNDAEISGCLIENTALDPAKDPGMGEGLYVGSAKSNWTNWSGGKPDVCDNTLILTTTVRGTRGECLDVKEATTGGHVEGCDFDGGAMDGAHYADSPVDLKGNDWLLTGNTFRNGFLDLVQTHSQAAGYGHGNVLDSNTYLGCPGYAVRIHSKTTGTRVTGANHMVGVGAGLVDNPAALQ